jgi:hypothetical protein
VGNLHEIEGDSYMVSFTETEGSRWHTMGVMSHAQAYGMLQEYHDTKHVTINEITITREGTKMEPAKIKVSMMVVSKVEKASCIMLAEIGEQA